MTNLLKICMISVALAVPASAAAQFHTIGKAWEGRNAETEGGNSRGNEKLSENSAKQYQSSTLLDRLDRADSILRTFRSVSLPLDSIYVTSGYGYRRDPVNGRREMHSGLDLRARKETVMAMMDGEVVKTGSDRRSGLYVTLKHADLTVSYCHLSAVLVRGGEKISAGQGVAISGNSGRSSGPHLHITVKRDGRNEDPALLLQEIAETRRRALEEMRSLVADSSETARP